MAAKLLERNTIDAQHSMGFQRFDAHLSDHSHTTAQSEMVIFIGGIPKWAQTERKRIRLVLILLVGLCLVPDELKMVLFCGQ